MTEQQATTMLATLADIRDLLRDSRECQAASAMVLVRVCDEIERPRILAAHLEAQRKVHLEESERERQRISAKQALDAAEHRRTQMWVGGAGIPTMRQGPPPAAPALDEGGEGEDDSDAHVT